MLSSGGPDFSYCFDAEDSMIDNKGNKKLFTCGPSFDNLQNAMETAQKKNGKLIFDFESLVQNKVPDDLEFFCEELSVFVSQAEK